VNVAKRTGAYTVGRGGTVLTGHLGGRGGRAGAALPRVARGGAQRPGSGGCQGGPRAFVAGNGG